MVRLVKRSERNAGVVSADEIAAALIEQNRLALAGQQQHVRREFISYADVAEFLRRHLLLIAACVVVCLAGSAFYVATTEPVYVASTELLIEPKIPQLLPQQSDINLSLDTAQIESQMALLRSEKIASAVIDQLQLKDDPTFNRLRSPPFKYRLRKMAVIVAEMFGMRSRLESYLGKSVDAWSSADLFAQLSEFERSRLTTAIFEGSLDVRRVGVSYAIAIGFRSFDPQEAAQIANATAEAFVQEQLQNKSDAAREGSAWLERRIEELRAQMNVATERAQRFRAKHDYSVGRVQNDPPGEGGTGVDELATSDSPTLEELEANAETYRRMYESFLEALTTSVHRQSYPVSDARVITSATPPLGPSAPHVKLAWALGALLGVMSGIGLAYVRHMLDRTILSASQLREEFGLECLGELPRIFGLRRGLGWFDDVLKHPNSGYSDSVRRVMTAIDLADPGRQIRTLGLISASQCGGKSEFASSLAALSTISGRRTLLVDADFDRAELTRSFASAASFDAVVQKLNVNDDRDDVTLFAGRHFDLVPNDGLAAGEGRGLDPKRLEGFLHSLESYERIILDIPPMTTTADGLLISALLDAVVIVVERGQTPTDYVAELVRSLASAKATVIGAVITKSRKTAKRSVRARVNGAFHRRRNARPAFMSDAATMPAVLKRFGGSISTLHKVETGAHDAASSSR